MKKLSLSLPFRVAFVVAVSAALAAPTGAEAQATQGFGRVRERLVLPKQFQPPAGMCRIWIDDVPPAKQPAPTDCVTALRDRPSNGQVVFGAEVPRSRARGRGRKDD